MNLIPLKEFQALCALSDRALVHLLHSNQIQCQSSAEGLLVDMDSVEIESLIQSIANAREEYWHVNSSFLSERLASLVTNKLSNVIDRAITELQSRNR